LGPLNSNFISIIFYSVILYIIYRYYKKNHLIKKFDLKLATNDNLNIFKDTPPNLRKKLSKSLIKYIEKEELPSSAYLELSKTILHKKVNFNIIKLKCTQLHAGKTGAGTLDYSTRYFCIISNKEKKLSILNSDSLLYSDSKYTYYNTTLEDMKTLLEYKTNNAMETTRNYSNV
jgi:hypothetical protein